MSNTWKCSERNLITLKVSLWGHWKKVMSLIIVENIS